MEQAPDLDGRPGEPTRSTLAHWIATCRRCRASAPDLSALPPAAAAAIATESYRTLNSPFLRWAALCEAAGQREQAGDATLQAAWAADDAPDSGDAAALRLQAVALWGEPDEPGAVLRQVDVLRRAGAFDRAGALAARLDPGSLDESSAAILRFQQDRIAARDAGRHGIGSALRPPARRPHAAHGRLDAPAAKPGLFRRLFGA